MKKLLSAVLSFAMIFTMFTIASPKAAAAVGNAAKIGTKEYATLNEAIEHVSDGETITLLRDVTDATGIAVESIPKPNPEIITVAGPVNPEAETRWVGL